MAGKSAAEVVKLFYEATGLSLEQGVWLREHSTFRIGGKADFFFRAENLKDLQAAVGFAQELKFPFYLIGAGSNVLFADEGYRGLLIKNMARGINLFPEKPALEALSGTNLTEVVQVAQRAGLSGLEFLSGIPGTIGGAVWGNAGAFGRSISDVLSSALIWKRGETEQVDKSFFAFAYRHSRLKEENCLLLSATLALEREEPDIIKKRIEDILALRRLKHPPAGTACAGSYFKNVLLPDGQKIAAGLLLDQAGVKNLRRGDAVVFSGHANFIINLGQARAKDILALAEEMKRKVRERFGVDLEEEVIYLPANASML